MSCRWKKVATCQEIEDFITDLLFKYPDTDIDYIDDKLSYDYEGMTYSGWLDDCEEEK